MRPENAMLHVRAITRREELDCLLPEWNALLDPQAPQSIFSRYEWVRAWFDAFGAGSTPHVLVASRGGNLTGVLPLRATRARFAGLALRRLDLMANGHSPRADLVARPGSEDEVLAAFAHHLRESDLEWDLTMLSEVVAGSELARLAETFPAENRSVLPQRRPPYIVLDGDWEGFRCGLSKNFQRALRNNRNRISRAGRADIELLESPSAIEAALRDVYAIGERSWQGEAGSAVGSSEANGRFYKAVVHDLAPLGLVRLWFLRLGGSRVAWELHVRHAGVEFGLKTGFDREHESLGVGTFLDQSIVERLFAERHVNEYDLLGDADPYKLRWTSHSRQVVRVTLFGTRGQARLLSLWNLKLKPALKPVLKPGLRPALKPVLAPVRPMFKTAAKPVARRSEPPPVPVAAPQAPAADAAEEG
jgi:CelD/BcsL family acetyltransferase involved in cellulose biosynthesis